MAKKKATAKTAVPVESLKHPTDTRPNIPTRETASFAADDGIGKAVYARDRSLDPQLVWKGKDEQNTRDLEVPAVPIYVQEKVHPQAIVEDVKARVAEKLPPNTQLTLFDDFNGLNDFQKTLQFYQHDQHWTNRLILGDSLLVMASLAEKERLRGKVQCIYFDPPYGIKFGSNWQVSTRANKVKDAKAEDLTRQPEQIKAFRDTWELGIHSYLSYMRDRLAAARDLLTESGSIFVQIGDENVHLVRSLMDEVFGSENFAGQIAFYKTGSQSSSGLPSVVDYLLVYAKNVREMKRRPLLRLKEPGERGAKQYTTIISPDMRDVRRMTADEIQGRATIPTGWRICALGPTTSQDPQPGRSGPYIFNGEQIPCTAGRHWSLDPRPGKEMDVLARLGRLRKAEKGIRSVLLAEDNPTTELDNVWLDTGTGSFTEDQVYVVQTGNKVVQRCILMTTDPGDLVLDPTCGSGTTAYVAEQWGRRWITIDTSRVALSLARMRLMAARFPYYLLADSDEGRKKQAELTGKPTPPEASRPQRDLHKGFVYKTVPHVTLKSIANNPDIDAIHTETAPTFAALLKELNVSLGTNWQEWEVPALPPAPGWTAANDVLEKWAAQAKKTLRDWSEKARQCLERWWNEKQKYRARIDAAIAKHADSETLFDQPYEDKNIVRLTGPFTVESLSPHKALAPAETPTEAVRPSGDYQQTIRENLLAAGVKGTDKAQRITFTRLDRHPGRFIHAEGETTDGKTVRVSIGPDSGTVGDAWLADAAVEAKKGSGCHLLLVCAFAFEGSVHEKTAELQKETMFGNMPVLPVRINPDLAMFGDDNGKELLKKTGSANLFTVFGEPDLTLDYTGDGQVTVTVRGLDVFDPTTGEVRSGGTEDIACWFIDTNYDGRSFFVRHAYFLGANDPYEKLQKALKAEVDEAEWSKLYSATSQPFALPSKGQIAVKVINHFGDEVLKVYPCPQKVAKLMK